MHLIRTNEVYDSYLSSLNREKQLSDSLNSNYIIFEADLFQIRV